MINNSRQEDFLLSYKQICSLLSTNTVINKLCLFSDRKIVLPVHAKETSIFLKSDTEVSNSSTTLLKLGILMNYKRSLNLELLAEGAKKYTNSS